jgi:hypothetical protein
MDLMDFYTMYVHQAFDPNANKQRFREEWWPMTHG